MERLTLFEVLEFGFYFELANHLRIVTNGDNMKADISAFSSTNPQEFMRASHHVLAHIVSAPCRAFIEIKLYKHRNEKRQAASAAVTVT